MANFDPFPQNPTFGQLFDPNFRLKRSPLDPSLPGMASTGGSGGGMTSFPQSSGGSTTMPTSGTSGIYGNLVNPAPGPQQSILNQMFADASPNVGKWLNSYASGILPAPMRDQITGTTNDQFGRLGARFGTDLGTAISRGLGQAGANQAQWAIGDILGLGGTTAGFEFQGMQNALDRALKEYLGGQSQSNDLLTALLPILLGGGGG